MSADLLCERCMEPIAGEPLEGIDLEHSDLATDDIAWTGRFYCSPGQGCNSHMPEDADYMDAPLVGWPS